MENSVDSLDIFGDSQTTSKKTSKTIGDVEYEESFENNSKTSSLGEKESKPLVGEIEDQCRGDDKFRCGSTSIYICEVERCDGTSNCPNGEDEVNCPSGETSEGSGEIEVEIPEPKKKDEDEPEASEAPPIVEPNIETPGDFFYFYYFQNSSFVMIYVGIFFFQFRVM